MIFANILKGFRRSKQDPATRKLAKIERYAQEYGVLPCNVPELETDSPAAQELFKLKKTLMDERITMLGSQKLDTLRYSAETCLKEGVDGDFLEAGVWRGGATIFLAAILRAHGVERKVYVADSFQGLPPPNPRSWPIDKGDDHHSRPELAISLEQVQSNFQRFDLLRSNIEFVQGFFEETMPKLDVEKLALLRLDGDMYGSTMVVLQALYHKLEVGGFLILDDWLLKGARTALLDFRTLMGICEPMYQDASGIYFRKANKTPALSLHDARELAQRHQT